MSGLACHHDSVVGATFSIASWIRPIVERKGWRWDARQHVDREHLEARESCLDRLGQLIEGLDRQGPLERP